MDFTRLELEDINHEDIKNGILVITNGVAWFKELPDYGGMKVSLGTHDGKVTYIEEETSKKYKL